MEEGVGGVSLRRVYWKVAGRVPPFQLLVLRLEDRQDDAGLREELERVYAFDLDAGVARSLDEEVVEARANGAKAERPPMRADTSTVRAFFRPLNER